jgi:hypothetical protein
MDAVEWSELTDGLLRTRRGNFGIHAVRGIAEHLDNYQLLNKSCSVGYGRERGKVVPALT